jgi:hypothetical protein
MRSLYVGLRVLMLSEDGKLNARDVRGQDQIDGHVVCPHHARVENFKLVDGLFHPRRGDERVGRGA